MVDFLLRQISENNISEELTQIGFDKAYLHKACDKFKYKNIKIFRLTPAQANIIKQTALIFGADCAVNRNVIMGNIERSDAILCGSYSQLKKIANKLKGQPFRLGDLGNSILSFLDTRKRETKLVGILNVTPDSFSDGGEFYTPQAAQKHLLSLIEDGADMIDIGAESTRPYSMPVNSKDQINRLKPVFDFIQKENLTIPISVDTRSADVAEYALDNGAGIINDVSGFDFDPKMVEIIAKYHSGVIIQHSKGSPENMQDLPVYNNVCEEIFLNLDSKIKMAKDHGIENVIIDPGIGFGKSKEDNFTLLNNIEEFFSLNCPIMVGVSRKSLLGIDSDDNALKDSLSCALAYPLIQYGIEYLRVHNVKLHKNLIQMSKNI